MHATVACVQSRQFKGINANGSQNRSVCYNAHRYEIKAFSKAAWSYDFVRARIAINYIGSNRGSHTRDLQYHLQVASKAFVPNREMPCNKVVSLVKPLKFLDKIVASAACSAAGHKNSEKTMDMTMDLHFCRLLQSVVGPSTK